MADNDQSVKSLIIVLLEQFFRLFLPQWETKFDFSSVEWLPQELFPDPPDGERREVDLLCRLRTLVPILFGGICSDTWLAIVHIEVEDRDAVQDFGRRAFRYYDYIRDKYDLPVLLIAIFPHNGTTAQRPGRHRSRGLQRKLWLFGRARGARRPERADLSLPVGRLAEAERARILGQRVGVGSGVGVADEAAAGQEGLVQGRGLATPDAELARRTHARSVDAFRRDARPAGKPRIVGSRLRPASLPTAASAVDR